MTIGKNWARSNRKILDLIALVSLGLFAYQLTFMTGERGFFAFNQSLVFDAGWRILSGQIPYKDFIFSHGFVPFAMQAVFFKLLGVNYFAYIFGAAIVNAAAALLALFIIRILFPERRLLSYLAGFLTAIWFYPPIGTPQPNYTGLFFTFAALCFLLFSIFHFDMIEKGRSFLLSLSGALAFVSFMSFQEVGLIMLPLYPALLAAACFTSRKKLILRCASFFAGLLTCGSLFALWVWHQSNWDIFWAHAIRVPMKMLSERIRGGGWTMILETLLMEFSPATAVPLWMRIGTLMTYLISIFVLRRILLSGLMIRTKGGNPADLNQTAPVSDQRRQAVAALLSIGLIHLQYFFNNIPVGCYHKGWPSVGILFSIGLGLLLGECRCFHFGRAISKEAGGVGGVIRKGMEGGFTIVPIILAFFISWAGIQSAFSRQLQFPSEMVPSQFPRYFKEESLKNLKWGYPTVIADGISIPLVGFELKADDVSELLRILKMKNKNFFIFPDHTIFYGLVGVPSPQPLLSFRANAGYYDFQLDEKIVLSLIENNVELIIIEEGSLLGVQAILNDFPFLRVYLDKYFKSTKKIGFFNLYEFK